MGAFASSIAMAAGDRRPWCVSLQQAQYQSVYHRGGETEGDDRAGDGEHLRRRAQDETLRCCQ